MSFCSHNMNLRHAFLQVVANLDVKLLLQEFSPQLMTFPFFLPVSPLSLCHFTCGSGSYQQFSLLLCRDCKALGWRKLLLRWGRAKEQWTLCKCELERALLSFLLTLRYDCQSHSSWEKVAEELVLSLFCLRQVGVDSFVDSQVGVSR